MLHALQPEMTLDEYEKLMNEKRGNLKKKPGSEPKADPKAFEGMKAYSRKTADGENELELTNKKTLGNRKSGLAERTRKEVCAVFALPAHSAFCIQQAIPDPHPVMWNL